MTATILFEELNINPKIIDALFKYKIANFVQILTTSTSELTRITKLSPNEILILRTSIINAISLQKPVSANSLIEKDKLFLSTGCSEIDNFFNGGLVSSWLTEISGESSSGKTQLCLQLCLTVQLDYENSSALYISTEDVFPIKRMNQICRRLVNRCPHLQSQHFMDHIFIEHFATLEELEDFLSIKVLYLLENKKMKLVVIDSIAAIARSQFNGDINYNKKIVNRICSKLSKIASSHNIFVVLINQVTDKFNNMEILTIDDINDKMPALGPSWAHWIHMRIQLIRTDKYISLPLIDQDNLSGEPLIKNIGIEGVLPVNSDKFYNSNVRKLFVLSAPHLPQCLINFCIDSDGIKSVKI